MEERNGHGNVDLTRAFLAMRPLRLLALDGYATRIRDDPDTAKTLLEQTVRHPLGMRFPPSLTYRRLLLKTLIAACERAGCEPVDALYEAFGEVLSQEETPFCYKSYLLDHGVQVTLRESTIFVSHGTTGLVSWGAAWALASWALSHRQLLQHRRVLELGAGPGLVGLAVLGGCDPREVVLSDAHSAVLQQLEHNLALNHNHLRPQHDRGLKGPHGRVVALDWTSAGQEELQELNAEVILAADVVYDPDLIDDLVRVLRLLLLHRVGLGEGGTAGGPVGFVASAVRNQDTYALFLRCLGEAALQVEAVDLEPSDNAGQDAPLRLLSIRAGDPTGTTPHVDR
ncbi:protein-lysine N-methyltransferase EEF2KMT-like [Lethenteron reissneri]|uniref:protein-lysine N-methyltransferase EEF2KMT-like n=1 Tax=Lethenteron reissneri TaxID=7753 RepID=UPI002AB76BFC|nr:protein-lysine N-methyltransferase EEF2KMT-like [Lethenteron reissneri]